VNATTRPRSRLRSVLRGVAVPVLVLGLLAALLGWAWNQPVQPVANTEPPLATPLQNAVLTCQAVPAAGVRASDVDLSVVSTPESVEGDSGRVSARLLPDDDPLDRLSLTTAPGAVTATLSAPEADAVLVKASGALAPGLSGFATTVAADRAGGGLTVAGCPAPRRSWWFVGAGATVQHSSTLVITNPDPAEAIATAQVHGPDGLLDTVGTTGMVVPPGRSVAVDLAQVAAGQDDLAINVEASQGRVVAAVLDRWSTVQGPAGTEWLPPAAAPAAAVTITGAAAGGGERQRLLVANPGSRTTRVELEVSDPAGTFGPEGARPVDVAPGSVARIDLPPSGSGKALALRLSSDTPVTAALRLRTAGGRPDVAYAVASAALPQPSVAPVRSGSGDRVHLPRLQLTAVDPDQAATATVEVYDAAGRLLGSTAVDVPAGTAQRATGPRRVDGNPAYLVLLPGDEPLHASAVYDARSGLSVLSLVSPAQTAPGLRLVGRE